MSYSQQLKTLTTDAQLHLCFFKLSQSPRYIPVHTANAILIKWLKPQVKRQKYKLISKEIKTLISIGRKTNGNLEEKLVELAQVEMPKFHDENELFCAVCRSVEKVLNVPVSLVLTADGLQADQRKGCFVISENITAHFNSDGCIEKPITIVFRSVSKGQLNVVTGLFEDSFLVQTKHQLDGLTLVDVMSNAGCSK